MSLISSQFDREKKILRAVEQAGIELDLRTEKVGGKIPPHSSDYIMSAPKQNNITKMIILCCVKLKNMDVLTFKCD